MAPTFYLVVCTALWLACTDALHYPDDHVTWTGHEQCGRGDAGDVESQLRGVCQLPRTTDVASDPPGWAPWTHKPFCNDAGYCVFTNALFRGREGVSFVTTAERIPANVTAIMTRGPSKVEGSPPLYTITRVLGKGIGVVATRAIRKDEVIMVDVARLLADGDVLSEMDRMSAATLFTQAAEQLPDPSLVSSLATSIADGRTPLIEDVLKTNAYSMILDEVTRMTLFPKAARVNHACDPNAMMTVSRKTIETFITAVRDIKPGEEVTVSYLELGETWADRQNSLSTQWGFTCTCSLCLEGEEQRQQRDERRERIKVLESSAQEQVKDKRYIEALRSYKRLVNLSREERLFSKLGELYWVMAFISSQLMDRRSTIKFMRMAYAELSKYRGNRPDLDKILEDLDVGLAGVDEGGKAA